MPFLTDNSWPEGLLTIFEICRKKNQPLENRYYGPYDTLLNYCFVKPEPFAFFIAPHDPPREEFKGETDEFIVFLAVYDADHRPVLVAEVKDDSWADTAGLRLEADEQFRRRFEHMLCACPHPRLWGLSLLGTSLRVYCGDVAAHVVTPPYQGRPRETYIVPRGFLEGEWNLDILSQEGFKKIREIVKDIIDSNHAV